MVVLMGYLLESPDPGRDNQPSVLVGKWIISRKGGLAINQIPPYSIRRILFWKNFIFEDGMRSFSLLTKDELFLKIIKKHN